jgi:hypothetical protein
VGRTRRALFLGSSIQTAESHVCIALYLYVFTPPHSIVGPSYKKSSPGRSNRPSGMGPTAPPSYICTTEARHNTGNLKTKDKQQQNKTATTTKPHVSLKSAENKPNFKPIPRSHVRAFSYIFISQRGLPNPRPRLRITARSSPYISHLSSP